MRAQAFPSVLSRARRLVAVGLAAAVSAAQALATWSIVVVDMATGEVGIGQATCLTSFDLQKGSGVIVVGKGAACAQSAVDVSGANRLEIFQGLQSGKKLTDILVDLQNGDIGFQARQYGIVTTALGGDALTFTGINDGQWAGGITGQIGTLRYAIQGNVLTGPPVVFEAEKALLLTQGALPEKLMAAMEAARAMGGDGRCSCSSVAPTSCGSPPATFTKSAHVGYIVVARIGDVDGGCSAATGCAAGSYFLNLNVVAPGTAPDPVLTLQTMLTAFRQSWLGHADAIQSSATFPVVGLPADGASSTTLSLTLADWRGVALGVGGASVTVTHDAASAGSSAIGAVQDHGNGTYSVPVTAGTAKGLDLFRVVVDDGKGPVLLYPFPRLGIGATCSSYGAATPGAGVPALACNTAPLVGTGGFGFFVSGAPAGAPAFAFIAAAPASLPFGGTGTLLVDPAAPVASTAAVPAGLDGKAFLPTPIPPNAALTGIKVWAQGLIADAAGPLGVSATQGIAVELL